MEKPVMQYKILNAKLPKNDRIEMLFAKIVLKHFFFYICIQLKMRQFCHFHPTGN